MSSAVIIDLVMLLIITFCVLSGYRKGIFKSVSGFLSLIISFIGANIITGMFSSKLSNFAFISDLSSKVSRTIISALDAADAGLSPLERVSNAFLSMNLPSNAAQGLANKIVNSVENGGASIERLIQNGTDHVFGNVVIFFLAFFVLFISCMIIVAIIERFLRLPGLKLINRVSGAAFGLLFGLTFCFIVTLVLTWIGPMMFLYFDLEFLNDLASKSFLIGFFNKINFFNVFFLK